MYKKLYICLLLLLFSTGFYAQDKVVELKILQTSDIHGNFFPYCFITNQPKSGGLSRVHSLVKQEREEYGDNLILLDNGDILQGQPSVYYYNYIDTVSTHLCSDMLNYIGFDAGNVGNHDIEAGHPVYDRWINNSNFPILGANIVNEATNEPHLLPYIIFEREGVKVAVLGMLTPAIPAWLPENLWSGLRFDDMEETARKWIPIIQEKEAPDVIVGLFHSGQNSIKLSDMYNENASVDVATNVPGFDIVMIGHDHVADFSKITNIAGDTVLIVNPANDGNLVGDITIKAILKDGEVTKKTIDGKLVDTNQYPISQEFMEQFSSQYDKVHDFVSKRIGHFTTDISTRPAYFGSSAFVDLIHSLQLGISGADISFAAPLSFDASIAKGDIYVSDMFNFYKYENMLYVMELSGQEIKDFLEESYYLWSNEMKSPKDHLLSFKDKDDKSKSQYYKLKNMSFNFDSAAGIIYTVDATKPKGEKIEIISMADNSPFDLNKTYKVALNSYRGNGGGELLTKGAGIPQEELKDRIIFSTDKDLRYYLMQYIEKQDTITPKAMNQWKFIPEGWTTNAAKRDYKKLFSESKK